MHPYTSKHGGVDNHAYPSEHKDVKPMLARCNSTFYDAGSTSNQHRPDICVRLLIENDKKHSADMIIMSMQMMKKNTVFLENT